MDIKYKTTFSGVIRPVVSKDKDVYLAKASLNQLRSLIPQLEESFTYDLLPIAANLLNVNKFNRNDDGIETADALKFYKSFIYKPFDLEHHRQNIKGVILTANITEIGTDNILSEDQVKDSLKPFNITVGGVLWRVVDSDLANLIEESNNILSEAYNKIFLSLEVGFTDYDIVKIDGKSVNLEDGVVVGKDLTNKLRCNGGTGKIDSDIRIFRKLKGDLIGLGAGLVENPAAYVDMIAVPETTTEATITINTDGNVGNNTTSPNSTITINSDDESKRIIDCLVAIDNRGTLTVKDLVEALNKAGLTAKDAAIKIGDVIKEKVQETLLNETRQDLIGVIAQNQNKFTTYQEKPVTEIGWGSKLSKEKISQSENQVVIQDKNLKSRKNMKFTKIQDITDETLKEATASSVVEFVETELKAASEKYAKEKLEKESAASELQKKHDELVKNQDQLVKDLEILKANLQKLEQEKLARETQATFNTRMASFEDKYTLTEDELAVVGSQIKDLNDEQYKKTEASLSVLLKGKSKSTKQEVVASENTKTETQVVDKALDGAQKTSKEVVATSSVQTSTLKEKYAKAFSQDQFIISK